MAPHKLCHDIRACKLFYVLSDAGDYFTARERCKQCSMIHAISGESIHSSILSTNQSINQPLNYSVDKSVNQAIKKSISQSINQSINQFICDYSFANSFGPNYACLFVGHIEEQIRGYHR